MEKELDANEQLDFQLGPGATQLGLGPAPHGCQRSGLRDHDGELHTLKPFAVAPPTHTVRVFAQRVHIRPS